MRDMSNYESVLRHVVRPDDKSERRESPQVVLSDYGALYLRDALREYADYHAAGEYEAIARGYVEYVERTVYDEERHSVILYAHTPEARMVLADAIDAKSSQSHDLHEGVSDPLHTLWTEEGGDG